MTAIANFGGCGENYAFKVVQDGQNSLKVLAGSVNSQAVAEKDYGRVSEIWLKATIHDDGAVTGASLVTSSSADTATASYRNVATITWDGGNATIAQGIKGSQNLVSCGNNHGWSSLYL